MNKLFALMDERSAMDQRIAEIESDIQSLMLELSCLKTDKKIMDVRIDIQRKIVDGKNNRQLRSLKSLTKKLEEEARIVS